VSDQIEAGGGRGEDVLRRFRDGVLALSLQDAPLDTLVAQGAPAAIVVKGVQQPAGAKRRR
jgi:hypothetical protein